MSNWSCSQHQKLWMRIELQDLGLWPGSRSVRNSGNTISLWRLPPQPELIDTVAALPSPNFFQLHPFFIWKPESHIMVRLRNNYLLPCLHGCPHPQVVYAGVGRPRVIVGTSGQYYILSSRLCCKACRRNWFADNPRWLEKLPKRFTNLLPAFLTYKKAICKSVMDELRRSSKSPTDMANQVNELMHLKYERAHLAYLHAIESVRDAEAGIHGQRTIGQFLRKENTPRAFGLYGDQDGWHGVSVSSFYLTDYLLDEFRRQEPAMTKLLQGTFGQVLRSDHTRKVARKVTLASGVMSSYAIMNENWLIVSWVMVQSETERSLEPMYQGMAKRYSDAGVEKAGFHWMDRDCCAPFKIPDCILGEHLHWDAWKTTPSIAAGATSGPLENTCASRSHFNHNIVVKLDLFHCLRRFSRECTSEHHPLFSTFCQLLSSAFSVVDQEDLKRLQDAYRFCGIHPANPTKQHIREHCRTKIPQPTEVLDRVEKVLKHLHQAMDPNSVPLFKPSMLKTWRIQRVHILRGCLSDPELSEGIMYRYGGTLQLNHVPGEGAKVPIWIPVRGTSQQEGYHFHQAQWITGTHVSTELFQAQGMTGVARWNYQRLLLHSSKRLFTIVKIKMMIMLKSPGDAGGGAGTSMVRHGVKDEVQGALKSDDVIQTRNEIQQDENWNTGTRDGTRSTGTGTGNTKTSCNDLTKGMRKWRRQALFEQRLQAARKNTAEKYWGIREILRSWDETDNRASQDKARQKRRRRRIINLVQNRRRRPTIWTFSRSNDWWDVIVPGFTYTQWVHNFRMSEETFLSLFAMVHPAMDKQDTNFRVCVPLKKRVAIALWKLATNSDYRSIGHLFAVSKTTVCRCVQEFCMAACTLLVTEQICFPDRQKLKEMAAYFENRLGLPQCVGAIDGSHIPIIIAPKEYHYDCFNRKGWHSIILQGVVDGKGLFWSVYAGMAGSLHDARVLRLSTLWELVEHGSLYPACTRNISGVNAGYYVLGDSTYPLQNWLLKPEA
ncbi:uncharacterized protein LOC130081126 [Rhinichthys klamathensis goyatoka]|uniref:uncharacterized protein LOC130081126 n=1 Tax=Rhinichthys klamathensis goyatoka TaxID=3034132 RepID=UPI0024B5897A|nr:uncharacterized protein LOC130081126 [Rhinichthys klamathensis goyatoka]